jgi:hypothetical protein
MLFILVHFFYVCKIMDCGRSNSAPFQPRHPIKHWIISWCVETLVYSWHKRPLRVLDRLVSVTINNNHSTPLHAHIGNEKKGFIKKKVMEAIITWSVENATLIPLTHVYEPTFESDGAWGVWSHVFLFYLRGEIPIHQNILLHMWMGIAKEHV